VTHACGCPGPCPSVVRGRAVPWITAVQWAALSEASRQAIERLLSPGHEPPRGTAPYAVPDVPECEDPPRCTLCRRPW